MPSTDTYFYTKDKKLYTKLTKQQINQELKPPSNQEKCVNILHDLDYPYIEAEMQVLKIRYPENWFGRYLAKMELRGFRDYHFEDSAFLNFINERNRHQANMDFINWLEMAYGQKRYE